MRLGVIPQGLLEWAALLAGKVPLPIAHTQVMYTVARIIQAGVELGVFETLAAGPKSAEAIARDLGTDPAATKALLGGLVGCGYLRHAGGKFSLAKVARRWLLADSKPSLRDKLLLQTLEWDWLGKLEGYVRSGKPTALHQIESADEWSRYQRGMKSIARLVASEVARRTPVPRNATALLDIGGAHGLLSVALCRRHPRLSATVLDLPPAVEASRALLAEEHMGDRVRHQAGDALTTDLGAERFDVVFVSNLVHHFSDEENAGLARRVATALRPGGVFVVQDILRPDEPGAGGQLGAVLDVYFALTSESGTWSEAEIRAWQTGAGLRSLRRISLRTAPGVAQVPAMKRAR